MRSEKEQTKAIYKAIAERVFHFNYEKILVYFYYNFCLMSRMCAMSKTGCGRLLDLRCALVTSLVASGLYSCDCSLVTEQGHASIHVFLL